MMILESYCTIMLFRIDNNHMVNDTPLSRFQYVVQNRYDNHSLNLSLNTNRSGLCKEHCSIIHYIVVYIVQR